MTTAPETSVALGPGFRCGFLGLLHADVFHQRLREEFDADVISTAPTVPYRVRDGGEGRGGVVDGDHVAVGVGGRGRGSRRLGAESPRAATVEEPMVDATIICASDAVGTIVEMCVDRRGAQLEHAHLDDTRVMLRYRLPLGEVASDFSDALKSRTSGFATFDYEDAGWEPSDVVRLDVLVNGHAVDALATLVHRDKATPRARDVPPIERRVAQATVRGGGAGGGGREGVGARDDLGDAEERVGQVLRGGGQSKEETVGEAKGGEAKDATRRERRHTRRGVRGVIIHQ